MRIKLQSFLQFIHGFLAVMGIIAVLSCAIFKADGISYFFHGLLIFIPFAATYLGEKHLKNLFSYILLSTICCVLMFFVGMHVFEKLYLTGAAAIIALMRIPSRLHDEAGIFDIPLIGFVAYFVVLFFFGMAIKNNDIQNIEYWLAFAYIIIMLIYSNLKSLNSYLLTRRNTANLPGKQIVTTNLIMTSIMYGIIIIAMLLIPLLSSDDALSAIGNAIKGFFRWLSSFLPEQSGQELETAAEQTKAAAEAFDSLPEASKTPAWLETLYNILFYAVSAIACAGVVALVIVGISKLMKLFYRPSLANTDVEELIDDENEQIQLTDSKRKQKKAPLVGFFDPNMQVRRCFKKAIKKASAVKYKGSALSIPPQLTPAELEDYAGLDDVEKKKLLHEYYEKARYSEDGCSKTDAAALKAGLK